MKDKVLRLCGYKVTRCGYLDYLKQYAYNLITWERSDHNLITFNIRIYIPGSA